MKFNLTALLDDETRAQIKAAVLGEARNIARSAIENEVRAEIGRLAGKLQERMTSNFHEYRKVFEDAIRVVVKDNWTDIHRQISAVATDAVEAAVKEKLKNKTVWEAEKQDAYVRRVVREELRAMLKG